jgi:hypothetical protein
LEFDGELELEPEQEARVPPREVERPPFETEIEPPPGETEPERELEIEPFAFEQLREDGADPFDIYREGVRAIETTIRAIEDR